MGRGLFAGSKMKQERKKYRWSDRRYKKRQAKKKTKGGVLKHDPLRGSAQAKGIVIDLFRPPSMLDKDFSQHVYMIMGRARKLERTLIRNFPYTPDGELDWSFFEGGPPAYICEFLDVLGQRARFHQLLGLRAGERVLDVGVGPGLLARELAECEHLIFVCGHYEGVDERVRQALVTDEISIGDYILTNGVLAAAVVADAVVRLLPGVLGGEGATEDESFSEGLLEYPQYTRPVEFRGMRVPDILLSGNHQAVARWRRERALERTAERRPDLPGLGGTD